MKCLGNFIEEQQVQCDPHILTDFLRHTLVYLVAYTRYTSSNCRLSDPPTLL